MNYEKSVRKTSIKEIYTSISYLNYLKEFIRMNIALFSIISLDCFKEATTLTLLNTAKELKALNHIVMIIAEKKGDLPMFEEIEGVPVYRLYSYGKIFSHGLALRKIQKNLGLKFDVIHSFSATPLFLLSSLFAKIFAPKAKIIHSLKSYSRKKLDKILYPLLNLARYATVPSKTFKMKLKLVPEKKIFLLYSPINVQKFYPQNKSALKKKHGYQNKKVVFYYGSFHNHKGVDNLLKAIPFLTNEMDDVLVILAPRYDYIPKEREMAKELGIEKHVEFKVDDIQIEEFVNLADVVVLPYNSLIATDGNPSCIIEAMACKTPVITAELQEIKELFDDCVFMTNVKNNINLAQTIKSVCLSDNTDIIERAYQRSKQFAGQQIAADLKKIYQEAVQ